MMDDAMKQAFRRDGFVVARGVLPPKALQSVLSECRAVLRLQAERHGIVGASAAGVPIVTLPGKILRGRRTLALYRHMGITDCVADSPEAYVEIVLRLGTDGDFHSRISSLIRERCPVLFDDERVGRDLARFLKEVTA
jgi:hypothetical protein